MWNSLKTIEQGIKMQKNSTSWHINEEYHLKASSCRIRPGTVSVAPAWFQQAHMVGKNVGNFLIFDLLSSRKSLKFPQSFESHAVGSGFQRSRRRRPFLVEFYPSFTQRCLRLV